MSLFSQHSKVSLYLLNFNSSFLASSGMKYIKESLPSSFSINSSMFSQLMVFSVYLESIIRNHSNFLPFCVGSVSSTNSNYKLILNKCITYRNRNMFQSGNFDCSVFSIHTNMSIILHYLIFHQC